ncbi:hypothetical protein LAV84_23190 [Rhizobium sp. VS19-DR104.2]|nr:MULTISPECIES: hypothetical protein [unclassified Rhizobium]MBZ5832607.1 hypothetical protein [Rhizobium sp. VS19-DR104.2]MBZ5762067.1 hypothetical protein [Rhizobium sp. VS19-DR96]MBZ5768180.1 hypothetical protein [Rhizobium sp. VS19-DR129.2]MBZ5786944.1 hypothetical protein [Rhizobium sp. VS19-DR121]MBZ5804105.1 hypothetical protein [Rhizobium sp. VS19-DR181]
MPSLQFDELRSILLQLRERKLPFHPLILVFSTGIVSNSECVPMARDPRPETGQEFSSEIIQVIAKAISTNPSIHDGAIIFTREQKAARYFLSAWSMRIVSNFSPQETEPNRGSAFNSAVSLSAEPNIDLCCIFSEKDLFVFAGGQRLAAVDWAMDRNF